MRDRMRARGRAERADKICSGDVPRARGRVSVFGGKSSQADVRGPVIGGYQPLEPRHGTDPPDPQLWRGFFMMTQAALTHSAAGSDCHDVTTVRDGRQPHN